MNKIYTWWDFIPYKRRQSMTLAMQKLSEKEARKLLAESIAKRDSSVTSRDTKLRLRDYVFDLQDIVNACDKANEKNSYPFNILP